MIKLLTQPLKRPKGDKTKEAVTPGGGASGWMPLTWCWCLRVEQNWPELVQLQEHTATAEMRPELDPSPALKCTLLEKASGLPTAKVEVSAQGTKILQTARWCQRIRRRKDSLLMRACGENKK